MASKLVKCVVAALTGASLIVLPTCAEAGRRTGNWRYVHPGYGYEGYYGGRPYSRGYARPYGGYAGGYYPGNYGYGYGGYGYGGGLAYPR